MLYLSLKTRSIVEQLAMDLRLPPADVVALAVSCFCSLHGEQILNGSFELSQDTRAALAAQAAEPAPPLSLVETFGQYV